MIMVTTFKYRTAHSLCSGSLYRPFRFLPYPQPFPCTPVFLFPFPFTPTHCTNSFAPVPFPRTPVSSRSVTPPSLSTNSYPSRRFEVGRISEGNGSIVRHCFKSARHRGVCVGVWIWRLSLRRRSRVSLYDAHASVALRILITIVRTPNMMLMRLSVERARRETVAGKAIIEKASQQG
jgi:hypothetical protein